MTIYRPVIWTKDLRDTAAAIATNHRGGDVASRAREIWHGARVGRTLSPINCEFVAAMRSRFGDSRDPASVTAERAFDAAWGGAWDAAEPSPTEGQRSVFFKLQIDSASDAFQSDPHNEIGRLLDATARAVQTQTEGKLYDLNGNVCGAWSVEVDQ